MADDPFTQLPNLTRVAALARRCGLTPEPYCTVRESDNSPRPPHKKRMLIDGVLCAISVQRSSWAIEPSRPDGIQLTQVHAEPDKPGKVMPRILIFDIQLADRKRSGIWSITRREFFLNYPTGHANISTGPHKYAPRGSILWKQHRGKSGLEKSITIAITSEH